MTEQITPGKFFIVDGMDGAGKTTAIELLVQKHERLDIPVKAVNVFTSTELGVAVRKELTGHDSLMDANVATLSAIAAVLHCYHSVVKPLLEEGCNVILDRGPRSSYVLQVADRLKQGDDIPLSLWRIGYSNMIPDYEIVMLADPAIARNRILERSGKLDRIESMDLEYHASTAALYSESIPGRPEPMIIENNGSIATLSSKLNSVMVKAYY